MLKLPIYEKNEIVKTYEVRDFVIPYGIIQDILRIIEPEKLNDTVAVAGMVVTSLKEVNDLLVDLFPGLTEEELRHADLGDVVGVVVEIASYAVNKLTRGLSLKKGA